MEDILAEGALGYIERGGCDHDHQDSTRSQDHALTLARFRSQFGQSQNTYLYIFPHKPSLVFGAVPTEEASSMVWTGGAWDGVHHLRGRSLADRLGYRKSRYKRKKTYTCIFPETVIRSLQTSFDIPL